MRSDIAEDIFSAGRFADICSCSCGKRTQYIPAHFSLYQVGKAIVSAEQLRICLGHVMPSELPQADVSGLILAKIIQL